MGGNHDPKTQVFKLVFVLKMALVQFSILIHASVFNYFNSIDFIIQFSLHLTKLKLHLLHHTLCNFSSEFSINDLRTTGNNLDS